MPLKAVTFKLAEEDLEIINSIATELGCSRTAVVRRALRSLQLQRDHRRELADAYWQRLFDRLPAGSMFMVGLEHGEPFVTENGRERLDDIDVAGEVVRVDDPIDGETEYVRIFFLDRDNEARYAVGAIPANGGRWLAIDRPPATKIA